MAWACVFFAIGGAVLGMITSAGLGGSYTITADPVARCV